MQEGRSAVMLSGLRPDVGVSWGFPIIVVFTEGARAGLEAGSTDPQCGGRLVSVSVNTLPFLLAPLQGQQLWPGAAGCPQRLLVPWWLRLWRAQAWRSTSGFSFSPRGTLEGESGKPWDIQERMFRTPCPDQGQPREPGYCLETSHWDLSISSESVLPALCLLVLIVYNLWFSLFIHSLKHYSLIKVLAFRSCWVWLLPVDGRCVSCRWGLHSCRHSYANI